MRPFDQDPECSVTSEFVRLTVHDKLYRLSCFQRRFNELVSGNDPDLEAAATPLNVKANAPPTRR